MRMDFTKPIKLIIILRVTQVNPVITKDLQEFMFTTPPSNILQINQQKKMYIIQWYKDNKDNEYERVIKIIPNHQERKA